MRPMWKEDAFTSVLAGLWPQAWRTPAPRGSTRGASGTLPKRTTDTSKRHASDIVLTQRERHTPLSAPRRCVRSTPNIIRPVCAAHGASTEVRPGGGVRLRSPRGSAPRLIVEAPMSAPIVHFITYYYYDYYYDYSTIHKSGGTDQTSLAFRHPFVKQTAPDTLG